MNDEVIELPLSREEVRILHQSLNNVLEFVPVEEFNAVMGVGRDSVRPLMERLASLLGP